MFFLSLRVWKMSSGVCGHQSRPCKHKGSVCFNSGYVDVRQECSWWDVVRLFGSHRLKFEIVVVEKVAPLCYSESYSSSFEICFSCVYFLPP